MYRYTNKFTTHDAGTLLVDTRPVTWLSMANTQRQTVVFSLFESIILHLLLLNALCFSYII